MHKSFADWYRAAGVEPTDDLLTKRWAGIEKFTDSLNAAGALDAVRVFHGLTPTIPGFLDAFREPFKTADVAFAMSGNDLELGLLSGVSAVSIIEGRAGTLADVTALGMVCADYSGSRRMESFPSFVDKARQYLLDRSAALRVMAHEVTLEPPDINRAAKEYLVVRTQNGGVELQSRGMMDLAATAEAIKETLVAFNAFAQSSTAAVGALNERLQLLREECDIFWWVFSGYSRDLDGPFGELAPEVVPLVAAKELADLIAVPPGPVSARAILDRVLRSRGSQPAKVTLADAIREAPGEWLDTWATSETVTKHGDLCPTLLSAQRSTEVRSPDAWIEAVEELTGVSTRVARGAVDLALQSYYEHLLVHLIDDSDPS